MEKSKDWTIIKLIEWGQNFFYQKGLDSPRLNIELMICKILNCQRIDLYLKFDMPLNENQLSQLRNYVKRRALNEPLQYILQEAPFCGLIFKIDKRALIPRPETEQLVELSTKYLSDIYKKEINVLEIGTGSGCISISLAQKFPDVNFLATDISQDALELAEENKMKFKITNLQFIKHDFLEENFINKQFDLILSNPPYIPLEYYEKLEKHILDYEPNFALTDFHDGLKFYKKFAETFFEVHANKMFLEIDSRNTSQIIDVFKSKKLLFNIIQDFDCKDRIIEINSEKLNNNVE